MSKAVMLSIRPRWVQKIANGKKTIEVRKTKPKLETPFKCYIYCTLQGLHLHTQVIREIGVQIRDMFRLHHPRGLLLRKRRAEGRCGMLICTCPNEMECPALLSDVVCFPWCEYLEDGDGDE